MNLRFEDEEVVWLNYKGNAMYVWGVLMANILDSNIKTSDSPSDLPSDFAWVCRHHKEDYSVNTIWTIVDGVRNGAERDFCIYLLVFFVNCFFSCSEGQWFWYFLNCYIIRIAVIVAWCHFRKKSTKHTDVVIFMNS